MNWNIIEYSEEYRDKVINLWIEICVKEFNFDDWHDDIRKMDNHTYKEDNGNFWIAINDKDEVIGTIALKNIENGKGCLKSLYVKKEDSVKQPMKKQDMKILSKVLKKYIEKLKIYEKKHNK